MAWQENVYGPGPLPLSRAIIIPPGGTAQAAAILQKDHAVAHGWLFRLAAWVTRGQGKLRAGEFLIPAWSSPAEILNILRFGPPVEHQVTIPEGLTSIQIARLLNAAPDATGQVAPPPEGTVLPQTYDYTLGTTRAAILARAARAMQTTLATAWAGRDKTVPLATPAQALTLASIVQSETPMPAELPKVAAVYENRLRQHMKLQADPTVIYVSTNGAQSGGLEITRAQLTNPSPYNTYQHAGLPPGPICTPGIAALLATLHPSPINALYFVATGLGGSAFTDDYQKHKENVSAYRWLKQKAQHVIALIHHHLR